MIKIYNLKETDFMGYRLSKDATFHHILKVENGGKYEIGNGAVLEPISHQYLHIIECKEIEKYIFINNVFKIINNKKRLDKEDLFVIDYILRMFEEEYKETLNSEKKPLIKEKYKDRMVEW